VSGIHVALCRLPEGDA